MNEIICPNCKKAFNVDNAGYADILKQVRDQQFDEELKNRLDLADKEKVNAVQLAEATLKSSFQEKLAEKEKLLMELKAKADTERAKQIADKEKEIAELNSKILNSITEQKLAVSDAVKLIEKDRDHLVNELKIKETETQLLEKSIKEQFTNKLIAKD